MTANKATDGLDDMTPCSILPQGLFQCNVWGIDTLHMSEACLRQKLMIADPTSYQSHWNTLCVFQNAHRQLAHQRLAVGRTLASDDQVATFGQLTETNRVEQYLYARLAFGIQVFEEGEQS